MKKLLGILVLGLLLNTNAQAKHKTFDDPLYWWNRFEVKGSENHYKFQSNLREDKDVLKEFKNNKNTGIISYLSLRTIKLLLMCLIFLKKLAADIQYSMVYYHPIQWVKV